MVVVLSVCKNMHIPCQQAERIKDPLRHSFFIKILKCKLTLQSCTLLIVFKTDLHIWCFASYGQIWEVESVTDKKTAGVACACLKGTLQIIKSLNSKIFSTNVTCTVLRRQQTAQHL